MRVLANARLIKEEIGKANCGHDLDKFMIHTVRRHVILVITKKWKRF